MNSEKQTHGRLVSVILLMLTLLMALMPITIGVTYSDSSAAPAHSLTYRKNSLRWDSGTDIQPDGTAHLRIFEENAQGKTLIAPGTGNTTPMRLTNTVPHSVDYTIVLYAVNDGNIPVDAWVSGDGLTATTSYGLPKGVSADQVIQAVSGELASERKLDFTVGWQWLYDASSAQDAVDTALGSKTPLDEITLGVYVVVEDNGTYVDPDQPATGDDFPVGYYAAGMGVCLFLLVLLLRRRDDKDGEDECESC